MHEPRPRLRRHTPIVLAVIAGALVAACGGSGDDDASVGPSPDPETTAGDEPPAPIPTSTPPPAEGATDETTIVTLDELAALDLLALGIDPDVVLTTLSSNLWTELGPALGIRSVPFSAPEPSFEALAALEPDLLVGLGSPFVAENLAAYEQIAPVVVIPLGLSWRDQVRTLAEAVDQRDAGTDLVARVDGRIGEVAESIGRAGLAGTTVSLLSVRGDAVLAGTGTGAAGSLLTELTLDRPPPQTAAAPDGIAFQPISEEGLPDHDADVVLVGTGDVFATDLLTGSALWPNLGAVERGDVHDVVGEVWLLGGSAFAAWWMVEDVAAVLLDAGSPGATADAIDRWEHFTDR